MPYGVAQQVADRARDLAGIRPDDVPVNSVVDDAYTSTGRDRLNVRHGVADEIA